MPKERDPGDRPEEFDDDEGEGVDELDDGDPIPPVKDLPPVPPAPSPSPEVAPQTLTSEEVDELRADLAKSNETIGALTREIEKLTKAQARELEEIKSQLPKISRDSMATVEGYFDFDVRANRLLDKVAKDDFERAKGDFAILSTIFR